MSHPKMVATTRLIDSSTIIIKHGEEGFYPLTDELAGMSPDEINALIEKNEGVTITPELITAYTCGSMFGWHIPAVANYV